MPAFAIQTTLSSRARGHNALELALLKSRGLADVCEVTRDKSYVVEIVT